MTGLEKIMEDIRQQSETAVSGIMSEASEQASAIGKDAAAKAEKIRLRCHEQALKTASDRKLRAESSAQLRQKQSLLSAKQEMISEVLQKALEQAENLPQEQYFAALIRIAAKTAHPGKGEICFNRRDLDRLPGNFADQLNSALPQGACLAVSSRAASIGSGFLLEYEGIEENCSFSAVLSARREELQDKVQTILFS